MRPAATRQRVRARALRPAGAATGARRPRRARRSRAVPHAPPRQPAAAAPAAPTATADAGSAAPQGIDPANSFMRASAQRRRRTRAARRPMRAASGHAVALDAAGAAPGRAARPARCGRSRHRCRPAAPVSRARKKRPPVIVATVAQGRLVDLVAGARHRQRESEERQRAVAAERDGVHAHAFVARELRGLRRLERAGGVDAVGQQDRARAARPAARAGASPRGRWHRRSRSPARPGRSRCRPAARARIRGPA